MHQFCISARRNSGQNMLGFRTAFVAAFLWTICIPLFADAQLTCLNDGTFDPVHFTCHCAVQAYGRQCEHLFSNLSPCRNASAANVTTIRDEFSANAADQLNICGSTSGRTCVNFDTLSIGWYRFESASGNYLVTDYPCRPGVPIGCGSGSSGSPYTLRHVLLEGEPETGVKLYSARAYQYQHDISLCYDNVLFYYVRILRCPGQTELYFMGPTMSASHRYCIGIYSSNSTASTVTTTSAEATMETSLLTPDASETPPSTQVKNETTTSTEGTVVMTPTASQTSESPSTDDEDTNQTTLSTQDTSETPTSTQATSSRVSSTSSTTATQVDTTVTSRTSTPSTAADRQGWNYLVNDSSPLFHVNITDLERPSSVSCLVQSNSLQAVYPRQSLKVSQGADSSIQCDFKPVLEWLKTSKRIYLNSRLDIMRSTGEILTTIDITVCQSSFQGKRVRHLNNRGQCVVESDDVGERRPASWRQWFGAL